MKTLERKNIQPKTVQAQGSIAVLHIIKSLGRGGAETLLPETLSKHNQQHSEFPLYLFFTMERSNGGTDKRERGNRKLSLSQKQFRDF